MKSSNYGQDPTQKETKFGKNQFASYLARKKTKINLLKTFF